MAKAKKTAAAKAAPAAKKAPNGAKAEEKSTTGRTTEKAGVGNKSHPGNVRVPESVLIPRGPAAEQGTKVTVSPEVQGNKALMIIDILNSRPVHVSLIEGVALTPETDGRLVYIEGPVSNDLKSVDKAKGLFAVKQDGTVIYNPRGFDEVPAGADFDLLDIVALIDYNHSAAGKSAAKKADADLAKSEE